MYLDMKMENYEVWRKGNCAYGMYLRFIDDRIPTKSMQAIYWIRNALADHIEKNQNFFGDHFITGK